MAMLKDRGRAERPILPRSSLFQTPLPGHRIVGPLLMSDTHGCMYVFVPSNYQPWSTPPCSSTSQSNSEPLGHVSFELFADKVPKTAENFCALSTGEKNFACKGFCFHRIITGFVCQGGYFTHPNNTGSKSLYQGKSDGENFILSIQVLESCSWRMPDPTQTVTSLSLHCQD